MEDRFELRDKAGRLIAEKMMCEHLHILLDEMGIKPGEEYIVKSCVSGYVLTITEDTTAGEWREYGVRCLMALD